MIKKQTTLRTLALAGLIAGSASLSGCFTDSKDSDTKTDNSNNQTPLVTETDFKADCAAQGGTLETIATCNGHATCAGKLFTNGKVEAHTCKGQNTCAGLNCKIPA